MSDLDLTCERCGQTLSAPDEMQGTKVKCPTCGHALTVPVRVRKTPPSHVPPQPPAPPPAPPPTLPPTKASTYSPPVSESGDAWITWGKVTLAIGLCFTAYWFVIYDISVPSPSGNFERIVNTSRMQLQTTGLIVSCTTELGGLFLIAIGHLINCVTYLRRSVTGAEVGNLRQPESEPEVGKGSSSVPGSLRESMRRW